MQACYSLEGPGSDEPVGWKASSQYDEDCGTDDGIEASSESPCKVRRTPPPKGRPVVNTSEILPVDKGTYGDSCMICGKDSTEVDGVVQCDSCDGDMHKWCFAPSMNWDDDSVGKVYCSEECRRYRVASTPEKREVGLKIWLVRDGQLRKFMHDKDLQLVVDVDYDSEDTQVHMHEHDEYMICRDGNCELFTVGGSCKLARDFVVKVPKNVQHYVTFGETCKFILAVPRADTSMQAQLLTAAYNTGRDGSAKHIADLKAKNANLLADIGRLKDKLAKCESCLTTIRCAAVDYSSGQKRRCL